MRRLSLALMLMLVLPVLRAEPLLVIASPQVNLDRISTEELASIYLNKKTQWEDGLPVVPVNRPADSSLRDRFSQTVFHRSPREVAEYWNRLRFQGKLPPLVQTSDQAVLGFVRSVPGAIGYIAGGRAPEGVKVLARFP